MLNMKIKILNVDAKIPEYATEGAAAVDLCAMEDGIVYAGSSKMFGSGISLEIPEGYAALVLPRSGLASKKGLRPANTPGLIDSDYRGEIKVCLFNDDVVEHTVKKGDRIAQLMFIPYAKAVFHEVDDLSETERGDGGFGSTGEH